jgi:hypothetical protein
VCGVKNEGEHQDIKDISELVIYVMKACEHEKYEDKVPNHFLDYAFSKRSERY